MFISRDENFRVLSNRYFHAADLANLEGTLKDTVVALCCDCFERAGAPFWFTDHGPKHSDHVMSFALEIAHWLSHSCTPLSYIEAVALTAACYLHDLGMAHLPRDCTLEKGWTRELIDHIRKWHVGAPAELLPEYRERLQHLYSRYPMLEPALPIICKAHGTRTHDDACRELQDYSDGDFRADLLGKILLLADELDVAEHRSTLGTFRTETLPIEAQAHQFKHHYVLKAYLIGPAAHIDFAFAENLKDEAREAFVSWTCGKLRVQAEHLKNTVPAELRHVFDLFIVAHAPLRGIKRLPCPEEVVAAIPRFKFHAPDRPTPRYSPHDFPNRYHPNRNKPRMVGPLYPALDRLVDTYYRELDSGVKSSAVKAMYIKVPQNLLVRDELQRRVQEYARIAAATAFNKLPKQYPFVITGGTGCGKTALVEYLRATDGLVSRLDSEDGRIAVVYVDCLNRHNLADVLRGMLNGLLGEAKSSPELWRFLARKAWTKLVQSVDFWGLKDEILIGYLRGVIRCMHERTCGRKPMPVPACFVLDNLDRMPGTRTKVAVTEFAMKEAAVGSIFFVITLRYRTKKEVDDSAQSDNFPALPSHAILSPSAEDVLTARFEFVSKKVLNDPAWFRPVKVTGQVRGKRITIQDVRNYLGQSVKVLCSIDSTHSSLIPGLAGNNLRSALTLYRAIAKYVNIDEFVRIAVGDKREHYLIRIAAMEGDPVYYSSRSKLRNVFDAEANGSYFGALHCLKILRQASGGIEGERYTKFGAWRRNALSEGIPAQVFDQAAWNMLIGEYALVEIEDKDERVPDDQYRRLSDIGDDTEVTLSSAGAYYLGWLMFDINYLECVLQDTPMEKELVYRFTKQ
jgi:hypothetical protein